MKCTLCHMPFRDGDTVYEMNQEDGTPNPFHLSCFYETAQGRLGYNPTREYVYGEKKPEPSPHFPKRFYEVR